MKDMFWKSDIESYFNRCKIYHMLLREGSPSAEKWLALADYIKDRYPKQKKIFEETMQDAKDLVELHPKKNFPYP